MKAKLLLIGVFLLVGCKRYQYDVTVLPGEAGHYVLVQKTTTKRGPAAKVYDCKSYQQIINEPAAPKTVWAPLCYEVEMQAPAKKETAQEVRQEAPK